MKLSSGNITADEQQQFEMWRLANPAHETAWQKLCAAEQGLRTLSPESKQIALDTLRLADKQENLTPARRSSNKLLGLAVIFIIGATLLANQFAPWQQEMNYATSVGKRENFILADGTKLILNTNSKVGVKLSLLRREIVLERGEVYIETGKDRDSIIGRRSFWVKTEQAQLEAIGTRFSVNQQASSTKLHVALGVVAIHVGNDIPVRAYDNETYMMPDTVSAPVKLSSSDGALMDPMAWIDGMLIVKQMRLDEFVAELSRYQSSSLVCDTNASSLRVSGVFQLNRQDPVDHALKAVARTLPVRIRKQDGIIFISKK